MKNSLILIFVSLLVTFSCKKDDNIMETSDEVSLTSNVPYIIFENNNDLESKLNEAFPIPNSDIPNEALERIFEINNDSTQVTAYLRVKENFTNQYSLNNNIPFVLQINSLSDFLFNILYENLNTLTWFADGNETNEMKNILCNSLDTFDLSSQSTVCIPLTFHNLIGSSLNESEIPNVIQNLNNNFANAKIQFTLNEIIPLVNPETFEHNFLNVNLGYDLPYDETSINIYIADYIGINEPLINSAFTGIAHYPSNNLQSNSIFIRSHYLKSNIDSQSWALTHELGHSFSLFHTFDDVNYSNSTCDAQVICMNDGICQTPESPKIPSDDSVCDDIIVNNFMSYSGLVSTWYDCERSFVQQQNERMRFAVEYWMSDIYCESTQPSQSLNFYEYQGEVFEEPTPFSNLTFSQNGLHMFAISDGKVVHQELNEKYNLNNVVLTEEFQPLLNGTTEKDAQDVVINSTGSTLFVRIKGTSFGNDWWYQYNLNSVYSISNPIFTDSIDWFYVRDEMQLSKNDTKIYFANYCNGSAGCGGKRIWEYSFNNNFTISEVDFIQHSNAYGYNGAAFDYAIGTEGQSVILSRDGIIERYLIESDWDISTMSTEIESSKDPMLSSNGKIEFYDEVNQVFFISTIANGVYKLHKYER